MEKLGVKMTAKFPSHLRVPELVEYQREDYSYSSKESMRAAPEAALMLMYRTKGGCSKCIAPGRARSASSRKEARLRVAAERGIRSKKAEVE